MKYRNILFLYIFMAIFYIIFFAICLPNLAITILNNPNVFGFFILFCGFLVLLIVGILGIAAYFELINFKNNN